MPAMAPPPRSALGTPLQPCSGPGMPPTGYERTGFCAASPASHDAGSHHVCLQRVDAGDGAFCQATGQENWCRGKQAWCVCEWAFARAVEARRCDAFQIRCDATNALALQHYDRAGNVDAAECIRRQCKLAP